MSNTQNVKFKLGETWTIIGTVRDSDRAEMSLTGATVRLRVAGPSAVKLTVATPSGGTITNAARGQYRFEISPAAQTAAGLTAGTYDYEVKVEFSDGKASIQNDGRFVVSESLFTIFT